MKLIRSTHNHGWCREHCSPESSLGREKQEAFFLQEARNGVT